MQRTNNEGMKETNYKEMKWSIDGYFRTYSLRKKPASDKHLTLAFFGIISLKSSQWISVASPPAEHPERSAWAIISDFK